MEASDPLSRFDLVSIAGLSEAVEHLRKAMPLRRFTVRVLVDVGGTTKLSHVRMCNECLEYGAQAVCSCYEIVLNSREKNMEYVLPHEWGHVFLGDSVDPLFARTIFCNEEDAEALESDIFDHIVDSITDAVVDVEVFRRVNWFSLSESVPTEVLEALEVGKEGGAREGERADPWLCTFLMSGYVQSRALNRDEASAIGRAIEDCGCGINLDYLNSVAEAISGGRCLQALTSLVGVLAKLYLNIEVEHRDKEEEDPLSGEKIRYTCIAVRRS